MLYHTKVEKVTLLEKVCKGCTSHSIVDQHIDAYVPAGLLPTETTSNVCMLEYAIVVSVSLYVKDTRDTDKSI